jgi:hypothetical protein
MSGIPSWARVGAKVVCITKAVSPVILRHNYPKQGGIYTVRKVVFASADGKPCLLLNEVVNFIWEPGISQREPAFGAENFRPLISQQDDIETHFKALLDVPEQVGA